MNGIAFIAIVIGALTQHAETLPVQTPEPVPVDTAPSAPAEEQVASPPRVQVLSIQATKEDRPEPYFDEELKDLEEVLTALPFDTFKTITSEQKECPIDREETFSVDDVFRVVVKAAAMPEQAAQPGMPPALLLHGRVEMKEGDSYLNALSADAVLPANQFLMFRGIPRSTGEMLALITPSMGDQQQQQQQQDQQEQKQEQDEQENQEDQEQNQEQNEQQDQEEKKQEGQTQPDKPDSAEEQEQQMDEAKEDENKPKDMQNIEAILVSLEELDEQEQHKLRDAPPMRNTQGPWW